MQACKRIGRAAAVVTLVAVLFGIAVTPATAAPPAGWLSWLLPTGTLCVATQGSPALARVAASWDMTDATVVADPTCSAYPRHMTLKFRGVNDPAKIACGWFTTDGWTWRTVRGVGTWTPDAGWVTINYAANLRAGCRATTAMFEKVATHEAGHWLGLDHRCAYSVMASCSTWTWKSGVPTPGDIYLVNRRY